MLSSSVRVRYVITALFLATCEVFAQEGSTAPATLSPYHVMESVLNVKLEIEYAMMKGSQPWVSRVRLDQVKHGSIAEKSGLKTGMEVIAIQGQTLGGLTKAQMENLLIQEGSDHVTFRVRR